MPEGRRAVAVIDDNPSVLKGIERILRLHGYDADTFTSAEAFLDAFATSKATCLVLDIHLGGMSGIELGRRLAASGSLLPIIFITAVDDEANRTGATETGCVAYLRKPFSSRELLDAIDSANSLK